MDSKNYDLERGFLSESDQIEDCESDEEVALYRASFEEMEDNIINYQTAQWVLYALILILAWGIGLLMLLYLPVRRYILRKSIQSKKLYITPKAIVYQVVKPVPFPCFGVSKKEKHVLLTSVADVVIEQSGYLQSRFGVYSMRIENVGTRRPPRDDVQIQGIADPVAFRKVVLTCLSKMRNGQFIFDEDGSKNMSPSTSSGHPSFPRSGEVIMQKLEEVGSSVKRVQSLLEKQHTQTTELIE